MNRGALLYQWWIDRIRSIAAVVGYFSSMCALCVTLLGFAILLVASLIPLYLNNHGDEPVGEVYCIYNHNLEVEFQIPVYNTTFTDSTLTSYTFTSSRSRVSPTIRNCGGPININTVEVVTVGDICNFQIFSIISPVLNATVSSNYALSEACYRTLQSCHYDPLLTSCLLSNCVVLSQITATTTSASTMLTNYTLSCTTNIYYKARCSDSAASFRLNYSSSQQNSACRQQRLNRINSCLNSSVQLSNVPCLITVSSGLTTTTITLCTETITPNQLFVNFNATNGNSFTPETFNVSSSVSSTQLTPNLSNKVFSASDQDAGHVYRISSVNSEVYASNQPGALYCGALTQTQIASTISVAINSQT